MFTSPMHLALMMLEPYQNNTLRSNGYAQQLPSVNTPIHPSPETPKCKDSLHPKGDIGPLRAEASAPLFEQDGATKNICELNRLQCKE